MNPLDIINKYYPGESELKHILLTHSRSVADKALEIADRHPELGLDRGFLQEGAMLHDIGIFLTDADSIFCFGEKPYICHGTGAGLSLEQIIAQDLPVPHRDMVPVSQEEQVICFADKFFSKTHLDREKSVEKARKSLEKYGEAGVQRFDQWCKSFL